MREACSELNIKQELECEGEDKSSTKRRLETMKDFGKRISVLPHRHANDDSALQNKRDSDSTNSPAHNENTVKKGTANLSSRKTILIPQTSSARMFNSVASLGQNFPTSPEKPKKLLEKEQKKKHKFLDIVLENIGDMLQDIENVYEEVTRQAVEHINQKDIIMTFS
mmetsp:Transcript_11786/g.19897  ORF Transcript_11786/g.19897 Transcript_11786/m.19897 type:complete len:167 (-) Transcript_11786:606-1106(-)